MPQHLNHLHRVDNLSVQKLIRLIPHLKRSYIDMHIRCRKLPAKGPGSGAPSSILHLPAPRATSNSPAALTAVHMEQRFGVTFCASTVSSPKSSLNGVLRPKRGKTQCTHKPIHLPVLNPRHFQQSPSGCSPYYFAAVADSLGSWLASQPPPRAAMSCTADVICWV